MANKKQTNPEDQAPKTSSDSKAAPRSKKKADTPASQAVDSGSKTPSATAKPKASVKSNVSKISAMKTSATKATPKAADLDKPKSPAKKRTSTKAAAKETTAPVETTPAAKKSTEPKSIEAKPAGGAKKSRAAAAQALEIEDLLEVIPSRTSQNKADYPQQNEGKITHETPSSRTPINGISIYRQARDSRSPIKYNVPKEVYYLDSESTLLEFYGITKVQAFIKDTEWMFVYWDFSEEDLQRFPFSDPSYKFVLRLLAVEPNNRAEVVDEIAISQVTTSWYVHIPRPGASYKIQIGLKSTKGEFLMITTSNVVNTPSLELVTDPNVQQNEYELESYRQLLKMSGAGELAEHLSSSSFSGDLVARLSLAPSSFSGSVFSGSLSSGSFASETLSARTKAVLDGKERKFWLVIDAEVIVYGATEPDANVSFMGKPIRLNPDGTFGVRMALPDGKIEFPVIATSADGEETKTVRPVVSRNTEPN